MKEFAVNSKLYHPVAVLSHFFCFLVDNTSATSLVVPNLPPLYYTRDGDVNIGGIISGLGYDATSLCGDDFFIDSAFHFSEAMVHAIDSINKNDTILPNVTLGFAILDDCFKDPTAAIQAISFLKPLNRARSPSKSNGNNETCFVTSYDEGDDVVPSYDVVGVVGCLRSSSSKSAAMVLGPAQIPMISYTSTSQTLSNKEIYPYFLRVIPADNYLVLAIVKLIRSFDWKYISILYAEGEFGETAYTTMRKELDALEEVCIATSHKIYQTATDEDYMWILKDLLEHKKARVVVTFLDPPSVPKILRASAESGTSGWFLWVSNDGWKMALGETADQESIRAVSGALILGYESHVTPVYNAYVRQLSPANSKNPWFLRYWGEIFGCDVNDTECATKHNALSLPGATSFHYANNIYDSILTYAHGMEAVMKSKCPDKQGRDVRDCITGPDILEAMKNSSFYGPTGLIEFDSQGSILAKFDVSQVIPKDNYRSYDIITVATYYAKTGEMKYKRNISFDFLIQDGFVDGVPESVCSKPCAPGEFLIQKALVCCWECRTCRNNEILIQEFTDCEACPDYMWPDPESHFTRCKYIPPDYLSPDEPLVLLCLGLAVLGMCGVAIVAWAYIKYRNARVIKASSKELSYLQLVAILTGYLTMPVLSVEPTDSVCVTAFFMYCLSFTWLYAPLLIKTIRIHRIFQSGKKSTARVKFISPRSQLVFASLLISVQVALCIVMTLFFKPSASLSQTIATDKYVELSCDWTLPGHISFLGYNLVLVSLCALLAFKTRKLPDNFNESRFISLCVYTTLIIWTAFIPTYYTSSRQYVRTLLLSLSLVVNHTVAMVFLFVPKIYAAVNLIPTTTGETIAPTMTQHTFNASAQPGSTSVSMIHSSMSNVKSVSESGDIKDSRVSASWLSPSDIPNVNFNKVQPLQKDDNGGNDMDSTT